VEAPEATTTTKGGAIGVGTWATQAEFKDLRVTRGTETLFAADFAQGTKGWKLLGNGQWDVKDGALRQNKLDDNIRAVAGDRSWTDYTYSLKARKLGGAEGFLILFAVQDEEAKSWWNIGGWGNTRHALELGGIVGNDVNGRIETGRWYDLRIELKDRSVKCYLDGKLMHDAKVPTVKSLYASASQDRKSGEVIAKVVNVSNDEVAASLRFAGNAQVKGPVTAIVLTSERSTDENTLEEPTKVVPKTRRLTPSGSAFEHRFPGNSLTVFRLKTTP
jgi:alpha-L-arabinofuranosidase